MSFEFNPRPKSSTGGPQIMGTAPQMIMTRLGLQHTEEGDTYEKIREVNGYQFNIAPIQKYHSQQAEQKFMALTGALNPIFNPNRFDNVRRQLQTSPKKDKDASLHAIALLYSEELSKVFIKSKHLNYAEIERMFYPRYLPEYKRVLNAVGLKKPLWWKPAQFSTLENLSRVPLERCNESREAKFTFEEWYNLFWNYYCPFSPLAYLCLITAQNMIFTKELVNGLADYIAWRHSLLIDSAKIQPILYLGPRTGKYGALLNATKKLSVPVIHASENPNTNPYLLAIPNDKQCEFKPNPIQKMTNKHALEKYEPSIVLLSEFPSHTDWTAAIRGTGSVREYICIGMADGYAEGSGWDTWGHPRFRPKDVAKTPPFIQEGWGRLNLHYLSRWVIHKNDSKAQMGAGNVVAFMRQPLIPSVKVRWQMKMKRFKPFF